jgi:hypothetical protein
MSKCFYYGCDSKICRQWKALDEGKLGDREEELCYLVVNILFTVMWRGVEGASKDAWKVKIVFGFQNGGPFPDSSM